MNLDFTTLILMIHLTALAVYLMFLKRRFRHQHRVMQAIIDSFGEPLMFYNDKDRLVYLNDQAKTAFSDVRDHINELRHIRDNSRSEGPGYYFTDIFGSGYRLDMMQKKFQPGSPGTVVRVKGYAKAQTVR